jgi:hypothetical protein
MSPDLIFILSLLLKMAITAAFVVAASFIAERSGPLIGAMVATLPIAAGPSYVFLALDHDARFIAASTITSIAAHAATGLLGITYVLLAQRHSLAVSLGGALAAWIASAVAIRSLPWTLMSALAINVVTYAFCVTVAERYLHVKMPLITRRWFDVPLRAFLVACLVGTVVTLGLNVGPKITGIFAVFPMVMVSLMLIMHRRIGGPANAALLANTMWGLVGFGLAVLALHLTVVPLGAPLALTVALAVSILANITIWLIRRRGHAKKMAALD